MCRLSYGGRYEKFLNNHYPRSQFLLPRSKFESCWSLHFFCKIVVEKSENKQKETKFGLFKKVVKRILVDNRDAMVI